MKRNDLLKKLKEEEMELYMSWNNDDLNDEQVGIVGDRLNHIRNRIEELEMENRRLIAKNGEKDNELDNNDTSGIPFDNNILVPDGSVPSAGAGVHLQVHKGEENHMKMVDDTPLAGNNKTMDILMKMVRYCRLCDR